jgi:hypothetical protein
MALENLRPELPVFAHDGEIAFGAVREVSPPDVVIYIENTGDVRVPLDAIADVHFDKVLLNLDKVSDSTRAAINRAHSAEDGS